jgi:twitching motility protein PilT
VARIDSFLRLVVDQRGSDLHFLAGSRPIVRHNGDLVPVPFRELRPSECESFLEEILDEEQKAELRRDQGIDLAYELPGVGRFRANIFVHRSGLGGVFRVIPSEVPTIAELGLPVALQRIAALQNGLVLFTGPTGCGKTSTQAALLDHINRTRRVHIVTIEDPIEFVHTSQQAVFTQREVGTQVATFEGALRSALRMAPDVVLVGEMRDLETISLALSAAETGVLVFGTLHTSSAARTITRIVDAFPGSRADAVRGTLSVVLRAVVAQRLVRLATGEGRAAATELLFNSTAVGNMIRDNKVHALDATLQNQEAGSGVHSLDRSLQELVRERLVTRAEAMTHSRRPALLGQWLDEDAGVR